MHVSGPGPESGFGAWQMVEASGEQTGQVGLDPPGLGKCVRLLKAATKGNLSKGVTVSDSLWKDQFGYLVAGLERSGYWC